MSLTKINKKVINAWATYDLANSVYNLVITATLFPIYYKAVTQSPQTKDHIQFLGFSITTAIFSAPSPSLALFA